MANATVRQDGDTLVFGGALERAAVAALWPQLRSPGNGLRRLDLSAVSSVDSAGLALLAELCERVGITDVIGTPSGLAELRTAYRLDPRLAFAS
ncbi:phospholipid transport system transporter-binding protein [Lysobacter niastensis]|jgi:phospholipid transport system transporter-binding protein|uniref:Phospholipid transport system transporter-binding protein n=1 Tax=Lysobacter niastensis TaxID=380629 RepID=A0ABU1W686_9GAMM|nr:STAS domain-containing protein [Lysobacter niastensis]MDR7132885.1 phospholipid transport system transporter-binding protein [Lysobacter niastensis]